MYIKNLFNKINKNNLPNYVILFGLLLSIFFINYNLNKYDRNIFKENSFYHQMIKTDSLRYMGHGAEIKKDILEGKNYFKSGRENYTKYLPPRISAASFTNFTASNLLINFSVTPIATPIFPS